MTRRLIPLALLALLPTCAQAAPAAGLLEGYQSAARQESADFKAFSAARGRDLFLARHGDTSCATCHTDGPRAEGRHSRTNKAIEPLAPVANAQRLSDPAKVEKWFKRNCNDVLQRACTAREKGDFIAWLLSVK